MWLFAVLSLLSNFAQRASSAFLVTPMLDSQRQQPPFGGIATYRQLTSSNSFQSYRNPIIRHFRKRIMVARSPLLVLLFVLAALMYGPPSRLFALVGDRLSSLKRVLQQMPSMALKPPSSPTLAIMGILILPLSLAFSAVSTTLGPQQFSQQQQFMAQRQASLLDSSNSPRDFRS